jgi:hypothetical protein
MGNELIVDAVPPPDLAFVGLWDGFDSALHIHYRLRLTSDGGIKVCAGVETMSKKSDVSFKLKKTGGDALAFNDARITRWEPLDSHRYRIHGVVPSRFRSFEFALDVKRPESQGDSNYMEIDGRVLLVKVADSAISASHSAGTLDLLRQSLSTDCNVSCRTDIRLQ